MTVLTSKLESAVFVEGCGTVDIDAGTIVGEELLNCTELTCT